MPDDVQRPLPLTNVSRLWRGLIELRVLDPAAEVRISRASGESLELPAAASPGALLAGAGVANLLTQVVWTDEEDRRDPYALDGEPDPEGTQVEKGTIEETAYLGMVTRFMVALDTGDHMTVVRQNLHADENDRGTDPIGRRVRVAFRNDQAYRIETAPEFGDGLDDKRGQE